MCGRFTQLFSWPELAALYGCEAPAAEPPRTRWNGAPTQAFAACRADAGGGRNLSLLQWGLQPPWSNRPLINARAETVGTKPSFRSAFRSRRCLVPANGWFEWTAEPGGRQPWWMSREDGAPLSLAGIWERGDGEGARFALITRQAAGELREVHHRQPVMVAPTDHADWLEPRTGGDRLREIMACPPAWGFQIRRVSRAANSTRNDSPQILEPLSD